VMRFAPGAALNDVSCITASICYAAGESSTGGLVMQLRNGAPGPRIAVPGVMYGIACRASECTASGALSSGVGTPFGEIVKLTAGKLTGTETVPAAGGVDDVALTNGAITAIGPGYSGTAVTTG
jgi:hypothetical protein